MMEKHATPVTEGGCHNGAVTTASREVVPAGEQTMISTLRVFSFSDLRSATMNFRRDTFLGEGGFGEVFKGWMDNVTYAPQKVGVGIPVAIKKHNPSSSQGLNEWQAEVNFLGTISHPNLVKLLGYCLEDGKSLLVYEYIPKGSLENHLFKETAEPLPWDTRIKIAVGAAQGLAFLHEKSVIYRDFKSSNILLDEEFNTKLSDFGLAKSGPNIGATHVSTCVVGTYGYAAPEYIATGHLYVKSDSYGFGVVMLEMITGLRVYDRHRPSSKQNLIDWARPFLIDAKMLQQLMDPRLRQDYPLEGARRATKLILRCLDPDPKNRPSMSEIAATLENINAIRHPMSVNHPLGTKQRSTSRCWLLGLRVCMGSKQERTQTKSDHTKTKDAQIKMRTRRLCF